MGTKIIHVGKDENRVSITLMGREPDMERVIEVLRAEFGSVHAKPKGANA